MEEFGTVFGKAPIQISEDEPDQEFDEVEDNTSPLENGNGGEEEEEEEDDDSYTTEDRGDAPVSFEGFGAKSLFDDSGAAQVQPQAKPAVTSSPFGGPTTTSPFAAGSGAFGSIPVKQAPATTIPFAATQAPPGAGAFGSIPVKQAPTTTSPFAATQAPPGAGAFGSIPVKQAPATTSPFAATQAPPGAGAFGTQAPSGAQKTIGFGSSPSLSATMSGLTVGQNHPGLVQNILDNPEFCRIALQQKTTGPKLQSP